MDIDIYERLKDLYEKDPEQFEKERQRLIDEAINASETSKQRLEGLQFQIDAELNKHSNPTARMQKIQQMFWEGVGRFSLALNKPSEVVPDKSKTAEVIPLHEHKKDT